MGQSLHIVKNSYFYDYNLFLNLKKISSISPI